MNNRLNNIQLWIGRFIAFDLDLIAIMFGLGGVQFLPFTLFSLLSLDVYLSLIAS